MPVRDLVLVLGDQLAPDHPALAALDPTRDHTLLIEAPGEATAVWNHKARIAIFLAAMRHFAADLRERGLPLTYVGLDDAPEAGLPERLAAQLRVHRPARLRVVEPGAWRLARAIQAVCAAEGVPLDVLPDPHFLCTQTEFVGRSSAGGSSCGASTGFGCRVWPRPTTSATTAPCPPSSGPARPTPPASAT